MLVRWPRGVGNRFASSRTVQLYLNARRIKIRGAAGIGETAEYINRASVQVHVDRLPVQVEFPVPFVHWS